MEAPAAGSSSCRGGGALRRHGDHGRPACALRSTPSTGAIELTFGVWEEFLGKVYTHTHTAEPLHSSVGRGLEYLATAILGDPGPCLTTLAAICTLEAQMAHAMDLHGRMVARAWQKGLH